MFGLERKQEKGDELPVFVHTVLDLQAFQMAKQLWDENARLRYIDTKNKKEFIRFTYSRPACNAWMQQDQGRAGMFELILKWKDSGTYEVFVIFPSDAEQKGSGDQRLATILRAMMVTPSIVPASRKK